MVTKIADAAAAYAKNATGLGQGLGSIGGSPARDGGNRCLWPNAGSVAKRTR
jgi:hypothetical protein